MSIALYLKSTGFSGLNDMFSDIIKSFMQDADICLRENFVNRFKNSYFCMHK